MRAACSASRSTTTARTLNIRARKAVIIATGGSTGNVEFPPHVRSAPDRGILRPRRHAVVRPGRQRRARRHGDRRLAVGPLQPDRRIRRRPHQARPDRLPVRLSSICSWMPGSPVFDQARAHRACGWRTGRTSSWSTCWASASTTRPAGSSPPTTTTRSSPMSRAAICNAKNIKYNPQQSGSTRRMAGIGDGHNGGGPIWAIFDADAVAREKWDPKPPQRRSSTPASSSAPTRIAELAAQDRDEIPARADAAAEPGGDRRALQLLRRCGQGRRLRQAHAALQDRQAAVLRRLGDAGRPRHARRPAHQRAIAR